MQEHPNHKYNEQRFQLTMFEQNELNALYENDAGEELLEEEKEYILGVAGEQYSKIGRASCRERV